MGVLWGKAKMHNSMQVEVPVEVLREICWQISLPKGPVPQFSNAVVRTVHNGWFLLPNWGNFVSQSGKFCSPTGRQNSPSYRVAIPLVHDTISFAFRVWKFSLHKSCRGRYARWFGLWTGRSKFWTETFKVVDGPLQCRIYDIILQRSEQWAIVNSIWIRFWIQLPEKPQPEPQLAYNMNIYLHRRL